MSDLVQEIEEQRDYGNFDFDKAINALEDEVLKLEKKNEKYKYALQSIDTHIRSTPDPVPYIVETLKRTLPEYKEE